MSSEQNDLFSRMFSISIGKGKKTPFIKVFLSGIDENLGKDYYAEMASYNKENGLLAVRVFADSNAILLDPKIEKIIKDICGKTPGVVFSQALGKNGK